MSLLEAIDTRQSIRALLDRPVTREDRERILRALARAPSAGNLQAYQVVAVENEPARRALADAALGQAFVAEAPLVLVFFADPERSRARYGERGARLFAVQDATIAAAYAQLAAHALGLGSVWVGAFDDAAVSEVVRAPRSLVPVALLPLGHPHEKPARTPRRPIAETVIRESY